MNIERDRCFYEILAEGIPINEKTAELSFVLLVAVRLSIYYSPFTSDIVTEHCLFGDFCFFWD